MLGCTDATATARVANHPIRLSRHSPTLLHSLSSHTELHTPSTSSYSSSHTFTSLTLPRMQGVSLYVWKTHLRMQFHIHVYTRPTRMRVYVGAHTPRITASCIMSRTGTSTIQGWVRKDRTRIVALLRTTPSPLIPSFGLRYHILDVDRNSIDAAIACHVLYDFIFGFQLRKIFISLKRRIIYLWNHFRNVCMIERHFPVWKSRLGPKWALVELPNSQLGSLISPQKLIWLWSGS